MPMERLEDGWLHAARLPLGGGWSGICTASGHEGETPSQEELREFCNLGYAERCPRRPPDPVWDSVRFGARSLESDASDANSRRILIRYVCEREHRPAEHGMLEFDARRGRWEKSHSDPRVQRMAECFLASYLERKKQQSVERLAAS